MSDTVRKWSPKYGRHPRLIRKACDSLDKTGELYTTDDDDVYRQTVRETSLAGRNRDANVHHMWCEVPHAASREIWNFGRGLKDGCHRKVKKSWQVFASNLWFYHRRKIPYFEAVLKKWSSTDILPVRFMSIHSCHSILECAGMAE